MISDGMQMLMNEHKVIIKVIDYCYTLEGKWVNDEEAFEQELRQCTRFFSSYADAIHHNKEEEELFWRVSRQYPDLEQGLIAELSEQHESNREYIREVNALLDAKNWAKAYSVLHRFCRELVVHIASEDDEFFPMCDDLLNNRDLDNIHARFQDIDLELGSEQKKAFEDWADTLHPVDEG